MLIKKMFYSPQLINGLMKAYFMKIQLKIYIILQLIIKSIKNIMLNILKDLKYIQMK